MKQANKTKTNKNKQKNMYDVNSLFPSQWLALRKSLWLLK